MSQINTVHETFGAAGYKLLFLSNNTGQFAVQGAENYAGGYSQRWWTPTETIEWAFSVLYPRTVWEDITLLATFILNYFPKSEVVLAALELA